MRRIAIYTLFGVAWTYATTAVVVLLFPIPTFNSSARAVIHRAEFDRVASQIEAGIPPATPFWIGPFKIKMAGRRGDSGTPYLSSNQEDWEIDGFVKDPLGRGFNLWSCITLDNEWSYIAED